jgi:capsular polysaccharide biosynthesis protein
MKKILLIEHVANSENFHTFPVASKNKILTKIRDLNFNYKNIFITRGGALHLPRNLSNQSEIENLLQSHNYVIINPELMNIETFINHIKHADNVFITWGGALTNLIYLKQHANVYILRSNSYNTESLDLFKFLFDKKNYDFNITIIDADITNNINTSCVTDVLQPHTTESITPSR